jgi:CRP-like cAMP-binding protein
LFSGCKKTELQEIAQLGTPVDVPDGKELTNQGGAGREFFIVMEGKAVCSVRGETVAILGTGEFFGEMALIDGGPRMASIVAAGPLRLTVLDSREFNRLLLTSPSIAKKLLRNLAERLRDLDAIASS